MTSRVNQQIGSYRLVKWVGKGGTGEVYLGVHVATGAQVAVKVMFDELAANDVQSFRREANIIARLHHPNIVNVLEYGLDGLVPYLVLTYAPNGTLRTRYPKGQPVRLDTLLPDIRQIADALQYVHDQHLVHRDIKPANVLIGAGNEVLLGDFGIAIIAQTTGSLNTQQVAGTIDYMAPEQLAGKARPASDQYSLATIVYELLAGRLPFQGTPQEIIAQKQCGPALPLRATAPHLPTNVQAVVMKALHQDPGQRFGSVAEFVTELEAAQRSPVYQAAGAPDPADATVRGVLDPAAARKKLWDGRLVPAWQRLQGLFTGATPPALPGRITWASLGLSQRFWVPRVCWNLSPLFFAADLLLPALAAGLWWHSWPVLLAALFVPLLALAVCGLGQDGRRRPLALVGAALCGLLWGLVGYALGTAIQNASAALAFGTLAGVVGTYLHIAAFPCRSAPLDRGRERRFWRWWLLCAVNMLALPLLLGVALRSPNAFALGALGAALPCVLGMLGDARNRPALWGLATLLLAGFWALVGWALGANAHTGGFAWGTATIPWAAPGLAVLGLVLGVLAHRAFFFARPLPRPGFSRPLLPFSGLSGKQRFWLLALLVVDLLSLPLALGLWFKSLALAGALAVGGLLLLLVMRRGYALHKKLPVVFGTFLTSLVWGLIGWLLGLFLGQQAHLKVFTLALSGQVVAGTWLSLLLGVMGVCFSPARHLALLYPAPKGITHRRDKLHTRIWLLCALDTLALPLVLLLALPGVWTFGVAASGALLLLVTAVCADVWEERGLRALAVLAGLGFWGICGWLGGTLVPDLPQISFTLGDQIVQGTWLSLALALLALGLGCWLHASVFSRWNK